MGPCRRVAPAGMFCASIILAVLTVFGSSAFAQPSEPIGRFVGDAHGLTIAFPHDAVTAGARGLESSSLPARGAGFDLGAHVYLWRTRLVTLGAGATLLWSRQTQTPETAAGASPQPSVTTKMGAFSPQVSLNFGTGRGWSYISGGIGNASISISRSDMPAEDSQTARSLNYGAGARWFFSRHLAFSFDIRFYSVDGKQPAGGSLGFSKKTYFAAGAGISVK
jgi:opacity protein-like surface antigen